MAAKIFNCGLPAGTGSGTPGADGKSAYEVAVANGFTGTEAEWLVSLVGAQGPAGADGKDGYTPVKGVDYFDGADGQSPVIELEKVDGTTTVKVNNADGTTEEVTIMDAEQGPQGESGIPDQITGTAETVELPLNTVVAFGETAAISITGYGATQEGKTAEYILSFVALDGFQLSLPDTYPVLWDAVPVWQTGCAYEVSLMLRNDSLYAMWAEFTAEVSA